MWKEFREISLAVATLCFEEAIFTIDDIMDATWNAILQKILRPHSSLLIITSRFLKTAFIERIYLSLVAAVDKDGSLQPPDLKTSQAKPSTADGSFKF